MRIEGHWTRHLVYRAEHRRTTWKLRIGVLTLVAFGLWATAGWWTAAVARSLVCDASLAPSDAILVENFDPNYLLFERAGQLRRAGLANRVLVPITTDLGTSEANQVELGMAQLMAKVARTGDIEIVPTRTVEPITLNTARDVGRYLQAQRIRSVIVVVPVLRSRRGALVYGATLGREGVTVACAPVAGAQPLHQWPETWHGIQNVVEQWGKLQYYRFYVLPFGGVS